MPSFAILTTTAYRGQLAVNLDRILTANYVDSPLFERSERPKLDVVTDKGPVQYNGEQAAELWAAILAARAGTPGGDE